MVQEIKYINIREVLSRVLRHPLLQDVNLEQAIQYTIDFIGIFGLPEFYQDKETKIEIEDYRGLLPCDLIQIIMVKECKTNIPLRSMTAEFNPGGRHYHQVRHEPQFKTQGRVIFTSFKCGDIIISYKAIPVDDEGLPMIIDNTKYLRALELYIRCQVFTILFDMGKITQQVLNHTEQEYSWAAGQLEEEFKIPSVSEMQSITNILNQLISRENEFYNRFEALGNKEHNKIHNNNSVFRENIHTLLPMGVGNDFHQKNTTPHVVTNTNNCPPSSTVYVTTDARALTEEELLEIFI